MYAEEIGVAEVALQVGLPVVFEPSLEVLHNEHHSTGSKLSRTIFSYKQDALNYLLQRYWKDIQ